MQVSRVNAGAAMIGFCGGWYINGVISRLKTQLDNSYRIHWAEMAKAKAEAIQQTTEKFLIYGSPEEHKRFQEKASENRKDDDDK